MFLKMYGLEIDRTCEESMSRCNQLKWPMKRTIIENKLV